MSDGGNEKTWRKTVDIDKLAQESGLIEKTSDGFTVWIPENLARFAEMVASVERDRCLTACSETYYKFIGPAFGEVRYGVAACSSAIQSSVEFGEALKIKDE